MILITGGAYQGKCDFAKNLIQKQAEEKECKLIKNLHDMIAQMLHEGKDPYEEIRQLILRNPDAVITVNELGCGIVPMEAFDREWRETTGRICCFIAKQADAVYRVICGIPTRIK